MVRCSAWCWWHGGVDPERAASGHAYTQALIPTIPKGIQALIRSNLEAMSPETKELLERMDQRADKRQREVCHAIQALGV
jgi:hypothetical protein